MTTLLHRAMARCEVCIERVKVRGKNPFLVSEHFITQYQIYSQQLLFAVANLAL